MGRSPGEENGNPLQYSRLEDPMDRGASWATVNGVTNSQTLLCLQSKSPQLRKQDIHGNANAKREFIASSSQGPDHSQHSGIEPEPRALDYSSIFRFRTKTGNWQGWIGYKGFFASTNWLDFHARAFSGGFHPRPDKLEPGYRLVESWLRQRMISAPPWQ